jgi:hypothetical protein
MKSARWPTFSLCEPERLLQSRLTSPKLASEWPERTGTQWKPYRGMRVCQVLAHSSHPSIRLRRATATQGALLFDFVTASCVSLFSSLPWSLSCAILREIQPIDRMKGWQNETKHPKPKPASGAPRPTACPVRASRVYLGLIRARSGRTSDRRKLDQGG